MVIVEYFGTVLTLAVKLAMPLVVAELILEFCMGILVKAVPQIQVMQVNIQLKLIFGLFILFVIANPLSDFIEKYMRIMIDSLSGVLPMITA
jgi:flagellar biosynthetic protein FliR